MPATPTSASSETRHPNACAVTTASRATGRSLVPAVTTATLPATGLIEAGSQKVRATRSCWASGKRLKRCAACASFTRVARQSCLAWINLRTTPSTHSHVLPSQKITSGNPHRSRRWRLTFAYPRSATGAKSRRSTARLTLNWPAFTLSSSSRSLLGSICRRGPGHNTQVCVSN